MLKEMWAWVLKLFDVNTSTTEQEYTDNDDFVENYKEIEKINFTSIFSNKLANYTVNNSSILIEGNNQRAEFLDKVTVPLWKKLKKAVDIAYGVGAVGIIPYVKDNMVYFTLVEQNRITINDMVGELITNATILAERRDITQLSQTTSFLRWVNYEIKDRTLTITQRYTNDEGQEIQKPDFWNFIQDVVIIHGVDRAPFGFIKCPRNNRSTSDKFGVPITFGTEQTITELKETLNQINREFELKQAFIGADKKMFKDGNLPKSGLYKMFNAERRDGSPFWEIFDPKIRESSYFTRLEELYTRLEKEVGTSDGILTKTTSTYATATEIKTGRYDTFTIVDDMRSNIENGIYDFLKAVDVLANVNRLAPQGDWILNFDWDYSLITSSQEQFDQLVIGVNKGAITQEELRQFIFPTETLSESEAKVQHIRENQPNVDKSEDYLTKQKKEVEEEQVAEPNALRF